MNEENKPYSCLDCDFSNLTEKEKSKCPCLKNSDYVTDEHRANNCPYDAIKMTP